MKHDHAQVHAREFIRTFNPKAHSPVQFLHVFKYLFCAEWQLTVRKTTGENNPRYLHGQHLKHQHEWN